MMTLGEKLRKLREEKGYTTYHVLTKLGRTDCGYIEKLEADKVNPSLSTIAKLSKIYKITLRELLDYYGKFSVPKEITLGEKIKLLRLLCGWNRYQLSVKARCSESAIAKAEKESHISPKIKVKLANVFNCPVEYLSTLE